MPDYSTDELDDLELQASSSKPEHQIPALAMISSLLERNRIIYGVMGGMNFYLRGSLRETLDVDIAVDNPPRMDALLGIFNGNPNIYRPSNRMQWISGVARLFVRIQRDNLVQVDLKPRGSEGNLIPHDLASAVEVLSMSPTMQCQGLAIGPLVAAKIKAHYGRETRKDYLDLRFVCTSAEFAPMVRQAAPTFRDEWKECFLEKILEIEPKYEQQVRWALRMERSPSPESKDKGKKIDSRDGGGDGRGGGNGGGGPSRDRSPKDGDQSKDRYWTYSSKQKRWYHLQSNGKTSWTDRPGGASDSKASKTAVRSTDKTKPKHDDKYKSSSSSLPIRTSDKSQPRDGDQSKDKYWTYNAKRKEWYHRHGDGRVSVKKA